MVVLLASYNGARYLPEQLDSIFAQSHPPLSVLVLDDGSGDDSAALLDGLQRRQPRRLRFLGVNPRNLGPAQTFSRLLRYTLEHEPDLGLANDGYAIALADQDDVWRRERLASGCARLGTVRDAALVHSDLALIDDDGRELHHSLAEYQGLYPTRNGFFDLLLSNCVTGCSALFTPALARLAAPVPAAAVMHDWWLALVASLFGRIEYLDRPLVGYRQHQSNTVGARLREDWPLRAKLKLLYNPGFDHMLRERSAQAQALLERFGDRLDRRQRLACRLVHLQRFDNPPLRAAAQLGARWLGGRRAPLRV